MVPPFSSSQPAYRPALLILRQTGFCYRARAVDHQYAIAALPFCLIQQPVDMSDKTVDIKLGMITGENHSKADGYLQTGRNLIPVVTLDSLTQLLGYFCCHLQ